jgi:hypothetical protein
MKRFGFPLLLAVIASVMIGIFALGNKQANKPADPKGKLGVSHENQGQTHIKDGDQHEPYNSNLPSSGPHYAAPTPWGIKDQEIADETLVHNLEHGGIVIAYKSCGEAPPDQADSCLDEAGVNRLKDVFGKLPVSPQFNSVKAVLVPRQKNTKPVQLAAWTYTLDLDTVDADQISQFYTDHIDQGPELVP